MYYFRFMVLGILFGIVMTKSEAVSWFRIQEMFHFDSIHMYGIIGTAVIFGAIYIALLKRFRVKSVYGGELKFSNVKLGIPRVLFGGIVFGLGWALTGACPGPMYTLLGHGIWAILVVIASAIMGTFAYGMVKQYLPH